MKSEEITFMLGEISSDVKSILKKQDEIIDWQYSHDGHDNSRFETLNSRLNSFNRHLASVAVVAGAVGVCFPYIANALIK